MAPVLRKTRLVLLLADLALMERLIAEVQLLIGSSPFPPRTEALSGGFTELQAVLQHACGASLAYLAGIAGPSV